MRERLMTAENAAIENGHIVIRDRRGVIRLTSNAEEDRQAPFDVNGVRLAGIQRLIEYRYGGPCDCDGDVFMYLSAAFNALALGLQLKRRKAFPGNFKNWARKWCPVADPHDVDNLAARVIARPRRIKASTLGKLLGLSSAEHATLNIEAIYPADDDTFEAQKKKEKAARDREAKEQKRREEGCQPLAEIVENSEKAFCRRHNISDRTLRYHKSKGPEAVAKFLAKKGLYEKLPQDGAPLDEVYPLLKRQGAASFIDKAGAAHRGQRPASGQVLDFNITDEDLDRLLNQVEADRRRAASRAAAASSTAFSIHIWERIARQVAANQRVA